MQLTEIVSTAIEDGDVEYKLLAVLPGQHVELSQTLLKELQACIYALISAFADAHIVVGRILPQAEALRHFQIYRDSQSNATNQGR